MGKKSGGPTKWAYLMIMLLAFLIRYQSQGLLHVFEGHLILMHIPPVKEEDGSYTYSS